MPEPFATCALCPRLCRWSCPVAAGTAREAAVPTQIAEVLLAWRRGSVDASLAAEAAALCSDCGRCADACHLHRPLPDELADAREQLAPATVLPVGELERVGDDPRGGGALVAVETDDRRWAEALSQRLGVAVLRLRAPDALGGEHRRAAGHESRAATLRARLVGRTAVVSHGAAARVLDEAGVAWRWLHDVIGEPAAAGCVGGADTCCGGAASLRAVHPADATRLAARYPVDGVLADTRCASHLRSCDRPVVDVVDRLLEGA